MGQWMPCRDGRVILMPFQSRSDMTKRILAALFVALLVALTTGCAGFKSMAFKEPTEKLADKKNPGYLLTVSMENKYRTSFQPTLQSIVLARKAGPDKWENVSFFIDMEGRFINDASGSGVGFAARMELEPGEYEFRVMSANSYSFLLNPVFMVPLATPLTVGSGPGVYYLGNIRASMRQRKEDELPAGPSIPIIDQASAGVPDGTFDVVISDRQATDEAIFRSKFPALASAPIRKAILPRYDLGRVRQSMQTR